MKKQRILPEISKGLIKENPALRLMLGMCPALAVTTSAVNGLGMGLATMAALLGSNLVISLLRKIIPERVRIPAYITAIAGFVTIIQMVVRALSPGLDAALGIFLPLIVVNCIIFARAELFAAKNTPMLAIADAIGMGLGFTAVLLLMGIIRELLGAGTVFGLVVTANIIPPMIIMLLPPGGFFVYGILIAIANRLDRRPKSGRNAGGCGRCPQAGVCAAAKGKEGEAV